MAPATGQVSWRRLEDLEHRSSHALAFDSVRGRVVLFGGFGSTFLADTWEWDGTQWSLRATAGPGARAGHAMAFDPVRRRVVLFGGTGTSADTWEWDGVTWTQHPSLDGPVARSGPAMAFDVVRQRVVLFGGTSGMAHGQIWHADTWEWDGKSWHLLKTTKSPTGRAAHAMACDPARKRIVLFGGVGSGFAIFGDTWTWNGREWQEERPAARPPARALHALAEDACRDRILLFGGRDSSNGNLLADTWEWDGTGWRRLSPSSAPAARRDLALAWDATRRRVLLFGGRDAHGATGDTWHFDGVLWSQVAGKPIPPGRSSHAMTYDAARSRVVLFGGLGSSFLGDTWEFDGTTWSERAPAKAPDARYQHAMAYDAARRRTVLYGGATTGMGGLEDTWEWDGDVWTQQFPAHSPPPARGHAMAYDAARGRVVLFGGSLGTTGYAAQTWEWDGVDWTQRVSPSPLGRIEHAMVYDAARARVVLFGGYRLVGSFPTQLADTWEYDGSSWLERAPAARPPARAEHDMAYDTARQRTVLFGGGFGGSGDTWEWDGTSWTERPVGGPSARNRHAMVFDTARGRTVLFSGDSVSKDTWEYGPTDPAAYTPFGSGCPGSAGTPALAPADGDLPWIGASFTVRVGSIPTGAAALLLVGTSRTAWPPLRLPFDLALVGAPGCTLLVSGETVLPLPHASGVGSLRLSIPQEAALVGGEFYNQGIVLDRAANAFGASWSNAAAGRVGAR
jgi:hypothetical protein